MVIVEYREDWRKEFDSIMRVLQNSLSRILRIEHIGSTSIPGMMAKPIIDIDIEIENMDSFEITKKQLERIGYMHVGNQDIEDREVFKRNGTLNHPILDSIEHHLYVCPSNSKELGKHILFRNYLLNHKEYVHRYNEIKNHILKQYGENNRKKYVEVKEDEYKTFFDEVIRLSIEEERNIHPTIAST